MYNELKIYDFDGTLVDSAHRCRKTADGGFDLPFWLKHLHEAKFDKPLPLLEQFKKDCSNPDIFAVIATARVWDLDSIKYATKHKIYPNSVIARDSQGDKRRGGYLKIQGIERLLAMPAFAGISKISIFEDNIDYLKILCDHFKAVGHYFPSAQNY